MIKAVPQTYAGVQFRSTLEAEWAYNLDKLKLAWSYEPLALEFDSGRRYLPDFWLPEIKTWLEVKGPDVPGLDKTTEFLRLVREANNPTPDSPGFDIMNDPPVVVVLGLAPVKSAMVFQVSEAYGDGWTDSPALSECRECKAAWWYDRVQGWHCRRCGAHDGDGHLRVTAGSGEALFHRNQWAAPAPGGAVDPWPGGAVDPWPGGAVDPWSVPEPSWQEMWELAAKHSTGPWRAP